VETTSYPADVPVYTSVLTSYELYCPEPTTVTQGTHTYTVTEPTTLTFDYPVTIVRPIHTSTVKVCHGCPQPTGVVPPPAGVTPPVYHYSSAALPSPTGVAPVPGTSDFPGAASHLTAGVGAGLAGLFALAAYIL